MAWACNSALVPSVFAATEQILAKGFGAELIWAVSIRSPLSGQRGVVRTIDRGFTPAFKISLSASPEVEPLRSLQGFPDRTS